MKEFATTEMILPNNSKKYYLFLLKFLNPSQNIFTIFQKEFWCGARNLENKEGFPSLLRLKTIRVSEGLTKVAEGGKLSRDKSKHLFHASNYGHS